MISTIALNSRIIMCSCVYTEIETTLRVIKNDFLNYVVNIKRYRIICYDFSSFMHWICWALCCAVLKKGTVTKFWLLCVVVTFWHDFETCYVFSDYSWLDIILCDVHGEVALDQVSLSFSPVFLRWSPFHYWCILFSTVHLDD